ncbi:MAG: hypothetical protein R3C52_01400 [Hyphomonadaceae bacterium]
MTDLQAVSAPPPHSPEVALPRAIAEGIWPNETVVWAHRGRGLRFTGHIVAQSALLFMLYPAIVALYLLGTAASRTSWADVTFGAMVVLPLWAWQVFRLLRNMAGPAFETYALTNKRVIHHTGFPFPDTQSLDRTPDPDNERLHISCLKAQGQRSRGSVRLRDSYLVHWSRRWPPWRYDRNTRRDFTLEGVDRPLELTQLIKTTLNLPYPIEDHTR